MIVEEQGIGFRTGVRLPSGPLKRLAACEPFSFSLSSRLPAFAVGRLFYKGMTQDIKLFLAGLPAFLHLF